MLKFQLRRLFKTIPSRVMCNDDFTPIKMLFQLLLFTLLCELTITQDAFLFVTTSGDEATPPGLYGARVSDNKGKLNAGLEYNFVYGYHCSESDNPDDRGMVLESVAYDDISGKVLLHKKEQNRMLTLFDGPVCQNGGCESEIGQNKQPLRVLFEGFKFSISAPKPAAFAYHNEVVYFVSQKRKSVGLDEVRNIIQLRRLANCPDSYPVTSRTSFNINACSDVLATIVDEQGKHLMHEPMAGLKVVQLGDEKFIFLTLQEIVFSEGDSGDFEELNVNLYMVSLGVEGSPSPSKLIHKERVNKAYRKFIMQQLGNIDFKVDKLCWSAIDRVICADFSAARREVWHPRYAIAAGEARGIVCTGHGMFSNITTGVAIADVTHEVITLFFGCMSGISGIGGTGYVRMHHYEFDVDVPLRTVQNTTLPIYSGQMFFSHKCQVSASGPRPPQIDEYELIGDPSFGQSAQSGATDKIASLMTFPLTIAVLISAIPG